MVSGALLIDKPSGMTSHDVVAVVRRSIGQKQVGHAGTLDPAATGLMVLLLGEATKLSNYILNGDKAYEVVVRLGIQTDTGDQDGRVIQQVPMSPSLTKLKEKVVSLQGFFDWPIPMYSAKKLNGKKLYELAREQKVIDIPTKSMEFADVNLIEYEEDRVTVRLACSKGSFIRTWAEQLGIALGGCASVHQLRRVFSAPYHLREASDLEPFREPFQGELSELKAWKPMTELLPAWPSYRVEGLDEKLISNGQLPRRLSRFLEVEYAPRGYRQVKVVRRRDQSLVALLEGSQKGFKILRVFANRANSQ